MSYQVQIPLTGIAGWRFLERTEAAQRTAFESGAQLSREVSYFEENIGSVKDVAELMGDRRLLKVALGAFGLESEIDKKAFIRKVLEEGTTEDGAFALRLTEQSYRKMSAAFGFGDPGGAKTGEPGFAASIATAYRERSFEVAVGDANNSMRLAMNFRRQANELSEGDGKSWFTILGSTPLRKVFETAFNLPAAFVKIDIDKQADILAAKTDAMFGTDNLTAFQDPENVEKLLQRFLAISQVQEGAAASGPSSNALTLLQNSSATGSQGLFNLLATQG